MQLSGLTFRPVDSRDESNLLLWRIDSNVDELQLSKGGITREIHHEWFRSRLEKSVDLAFTAFSLGTTPVAYARVENYEDGWVISILVSPDHRNKGIGSYTCEIFVRELQMQINCPPLYAIIHRRNLPSIRLFTKLGFCLSREVNGEFLEFILC
jgi:RimJ/RimL family protein N-acetyltransferase